MSGSEVQCERAAEGVAVVTLNRPDVHNAITTPMQRRLDAVLAGLRDDEGVRVVVVTGAGTRAFSAGYDIKEFEAYDDDQMLENYVERQGLMGAVAEFAKPLVGALNGVVHGGGAILATLLDIRVGGSSTDFRFTAARYGGVNNTWQLPRIVGLARALEYTMTARRIGAEEALQCGLLNHVVPDGAVLEKAIEIAGQIAAHPPAGIAWHKCLIHANHDRPLMEAYAAENAVMNGPLRPRRPAALFQDFLTKHPKR